MTHTPLAAALRRLAACSDRASRSGRPVEEEWARGSARRQSRREFLTAGAAALPLASAWRRLPRLASHNEKVVIIGGGLAGLTCAYRLKQQGIHADLIEGNSRLGGRCATLRGAFAEGQIVERGGELIDTRHKEIRALAAELGLVLDDLQADQPAGTDLLGFFDGARYSWTEATLDFGRIYPAIQQDLAALLTIGDAHPPARAIDLDNMTVATWIEHGVPGGLTSRLGKLLDVACTTEFGLDSAEASGANLIWMLGGSPGERLEIFGDSDERYHIRGGNDQLVSLMAQRLEGQITTGCRLESLARTAAGRYEVGVATDSSHKRITADRVVLALPFTTLHRMVDCSKAGFGPKKRTIIAEYRLGTNAKHHLQFRSRHWRGQGSTGETFADTGYQNSWEVTRSQPGTAGILVDYTGGAIGFASNRGSLEQRSRAVLQQFEPVMPGSVDGWNGQAAREYWPGNPWSLGSYSCYTPGQYRRFGNSAAARSNNCHFAGEHTSLESQGFLNGGVESGERAAREIIGS